jgi:hypothetical protein
MRTTALVLALLLLGAAGCARPIQQQAVEHPPPAPLAANECPSARCWPPSFVEAPAGCVARHAYVCMQLDTSVPPRKLCPDGTSVDGETGRCLKAADGSCYREVSRCPPPPSR